VDKQLSTILYLLYFLLILFLLPALVSSVTSIMFHFSSRRSHSRAALNFVSSLSCLCRKAAVDKRPATFQLAQLCTTSCLSLRCGPEAVVEVCSRLPFSVLCMSQVSTGLPHFRCSLLTLSSLLVSSTEHQVAPLCSTHLHTET
jgi:hypothetical protein